MTGDESEEESGPGALHSVPDDTRKEKTVTGSAEGTRKRVDLDPGDESEEESGLGSGCKKIKLAVEKEENGMKTACHICDKRFAKAGNVRIHNYQSSQTDSS